MLTCLRGPTAQGAEDTGTCEVLQQPTPTRLSDSSDLSDSNEREREKEGGREMEGEGERERERRREGEGEGERKMVKALTQVGMREAC